MTKNEKLIQAIEGAANEMAAEFGGEPINPDSVIERSDGTVVLHSENGDSAAALFFDDYMGGYDFIDRLCTLGDRVADRLRVQGHFENETGCTAIFYED